MKAAPPFGHYNPKSDTLFLRVLTKIGLSRGKVNKLISKAWRKRGYDKVDVEIHGIKYRLHTSINTTDAKILTSSKYYEKLELQALSLPLGSNGASPKIFVDVGTNTGYYTLELWKRGFDRIISIEPNPETLRILEENIRINGAMDKIHVAPYCVGEDSEVDFYSSAGLGSASLLGKNHPNSKVIRVRSKPLTEILKECSVTAIDAMKIDIEGYEDSALIPFFENCAPELRPKILVIEHCHSSEWKTDIIEYMKGIGYGIRDRTRANTILEMNEQDVSPNR